MLKYINQEWEIKGDNDQKIVASLIALRLRLWDQRAIDLKNEFMKIWTNLSANLKKRHEINQLIEHSYFLTSCSLEIQRKDKQVQNWKSNSI